MRQPSEQPLAEHSEYVTEDETTAKQMIAYLKEHPQPGRATFLPLTSVKKRDNSLRTDVLQENGVIGYADTLVHTADRYRGDRRVSAWQNTGGGSYRSCHRTGTKISLFPADRNAGGRIPADPGGSMTGGAFRNNSNLRGKKPVRFPFWKKAYWDLKTQMQETTARLEDIRTARELLKEDLSEVRESIQSARLEQNTARMNLERRQDEQKQQAEFYADIQKENRQLQQQTEEIRAEQEALREKMSDSAGIEEELQEENLILQEKLDQLQKEIQTGQQTPVGNPDGRIFCSPERSIFTGKSGTYPGRNRKASSGAVTDPYKFFQSGSRDQAKTAGAVTDS